MKKANKPSKGLEAKPCIRRRAQRTKSTGGQFTVSDELWTLMAPLLAEHPNRHRFGGGRPRVPDRVCADAIFFALRSGCQWNARSANRAGVHRWPVGLEAGAV